MSMHIQVSWILFSQYFCAGIRILEFPLLIYNNLCLNLIYNFLQTSGSSQGYLAEIHKRVSETCMAQAQREKRRRRVLVEQMKALHELEVVIV